MESKAAGSNAEIILQLQALKRKVLNDKNTDQRGTRLLVSMRHLVAFYAATGHGVDYFERDFPVQVVRADVEMPTLVKLY